MTLAFRALVVATLVVFAPLLSACSERSVGDAERRAVATAGTTPAPIDVQINSMFVTIENRVGQPILDTQVAIKSAAGTPFTTTIGRLQPGEKRELPISKFVNAGQVAFNQRTMRPKEVVVTAQDFVGRRYEVMVPWTAN